VPEANENGTRLPSASVLGHYQFSAERPGRCIRISGAAFGRVSMDGRTGSTSGRRPVALSEQPAITSPIDEQIWEPSMSEELRHLQQWWNREDSHAKYAKYKVEDTEVLIGPSPFTTGFRSEMFRSIDGWISVNDQVPMMPPGSLYQWFPWPIHERPTNSMIFAFVQTMDHWVRTLKLKRVYIHCLHGGQRAPTMFAFYLWAKHRQAFKQLVVPSEIVNMVETKMMPEQYFWSYIESYPDIKSFLDALAESDESTYMDSINITIKNRILDSIRQVRLQLQMNYHSTKYKIASAFTSIWNQYLRSKRRTRKYVFKDWNVDMVQSGRVLRVEDSFVLAFSFRPKYEIRIPLENYMGPNPPKVDEEVEIIFLRHKVDRYWTLTVKLNPASNAATEDKVEASS
jgi:hypothetical protein